VPSGTPNYVTSADLQNRIHRASTFLGYSSDR
jgi:hypothetical protein